MPKIATKQVCKLMSAIVAPAEYLLLELPVQYNCAASLLLIDSITSHCFVQQSEIFTSSAMFKGSELKVQLATGCKFHTNTKCLLQITFNPGLKNIVDYYVIDKLTMPAILGMQWL